VTALDVKPVREETPQRPWTRAYGSVVTGTILVLVGALWLLDAIDVIELQAAVVLPAVLAVVGVALIFGAFDGPHSGLVVFGVFLTVAVVAAAVTPFDSWRGGVGERQHNVTNSSELAPSYRLGMGELRIDLSDLRLTESTTVSASVGAGTIELVLPPDLAVSIAANVGAGEIDLLGETADGLAVSRTYVSPDFDTAEVALTLDLDVSAGEIEVTR
jgi:hypothetical protein